MLTGRLKTMVKTLIKLSSRTEKSRWNEESCSFNNFASRLRSAFDTEQVCSLSGSWNFRPLLLSIPSAVYNKSIRHHNRTILIIMISFFSQFLIIHSSWLSISHWPLIYRNRPNFVVLCSPTSHGCTTNVGIRPILTNLSRPRKTGENPVSLPTCHHSHHFDTFNTNR